MTVRGEGSLRVLFVATDEFRFVAFDFGVLAVKLGSGEFC